LPSKSWKESREKSMNCTGSGKAVEMSDPHRHKGAPCEVGALNRCLCRMVVNIGAELNTEIECQQPGCETQWVSSTVPLRTGLYLWLRVLQYHLQCIALK
jgi:hypothetical protein